MTALNEALSHTLNHPLHQARQLLENSRRFVQASDDPYVISRFGDVQIRIDVAAALLERADTHPSPVALTEAQIAAAEALIAASNAEFELTGQRTALPSTLDDPLRRKYQAVGNYHLNGVL
ncbi:acyl-CoA dehydrogenase [Pseudomonas sp. M5A4_2d]